MADKKLSSVSAVSDMNYVYAETASGETVKISKADLASVVAGLIGIDSSIFKSRTTLGNDSNLNNITQSGVYAINPNQGSSGGNKPTNAPAGAGVYFGTLIVFGPSTTAGNPVTQIYITSFNTFTVFIRSSWGSNWMGWTKIV